MKTTSTSFVKKINTAPQLYKTQKGVKPYANQQYSISSGTPTLDAFIGGGFPLGSLVVLYEDTYSHYYSHIQKSYLAEGVVNEHKLLVVDPEEHREREYWLKFLPAVYKYKDPKETVVEETKKQEDSLKVAWRYQSLVDGDSETGLPVSSLSSASGETIRYRFDSSREMGSAFANSMSHQLDKETYLVHMKHSES